MKKIIFLEKIRQNQNFGKRGLSTVITSMILILLVLVAVGIVWVVIKNMIDESIDDISLGKITTNIEVKAITLDVVNNNITLNIKRNVGEGELKGIKVIFTNSTGNQEIFDLDVQLSELGSLIHTFNLSMNVSTVTNVQITPILNSGSGKDLLGSSKDFKVDTSSSISGSSSSSSGGPSCTDGDGDGYNTTIGGGCGIVADCNDGNVNVNQTISCSYDGASCGTYNLCLASCPTPPSEICGNSIDEDCDGSDLSCVTFLTSTYSDSLVSWWRMNDDPSDGINDELGLNPGTCTNCPTLSTNNWGNPNQAIDFDGINDQISFGNNPSISNLNNNMTILAWINFTNTPTVGDTILGRPNWFWHFQLMSNNRIQFRRWSPYQSTQSNAVLTPNQWYHIGTTLSPDAINNNKIYINGILDNTRTIIVPLGGFGGATRLSGRIQNDIDWFDGLIDEVMIFNRSLSALEINTIYNMNLSS